MQLHVELLEINSANPTRENTKPTLGNRSALILGEDIGAGLKYAAGQDFHSVVLFPLRLMILRMFCAQKRWSLFLQAALRSG